MTTYTPPPGPGRTASRRNRPVRLVIGILPALVGLPLLLGGFGLGWATATQRDDDGFFSTPTEQASTETVALSSQVVNFGNAGPDDWWANRDLATVRCAPGPRTHRPSSSRSHRAPTWRATCAARPTTRSATCAPTRSTTR